MCVCVCVCVQTVDERDRRIARLNASLEVYAHSSLPQHRAGASSDDVDQNSKQLLQERDGVIAELWSRLAVTQAARPDVDPREVHRLKEHVLALEEKCQKLDREKEQLQVAHAPCATALQDKDEQMKELKAVKPHLVRLDVKLAEEFEKEETLAKQIAEEKGKEAKLEKDLKKTKDDLEEDEKLLAEDLKVS